MSTVVGIDAGRKGLEDVLDAVVCAYVALKFLEGRAEAFGDRQSAIWVPLAG